ncbi:MAG: metalloregulator ArsR/SmtB family transcription factor [Armatimonadota bacterium]
MASDKLSLVFSALADPTRRAILAALALGPMPVGEIAKPFAMSEPAVIKHLKVLEKAGLVETDRKGQMRPRTLNPQPLAEANSWVEQYRQHWEASFDRLDAYLQELQAGEQE